MWGFSSPYAHIVSVHLPIKVKRSFGAENQFFLRSAAACRYKTANGGSSSSVKACSNCSLYGLTRRRLRRIRHTTGCGMSSSRLARLVDLRRLLHPLLRRVSLACAFCDTQALVTVEFFILLLHGVLHRRVLSELGSTTWLHRHNRVRSGILKHANCLLWSRRHFHSTCTPGGHRRN
jgi:hypothetical protein